MDIQHQPLYTTETMSHALRIMLSASIPVAGVLWWDWSAYSVVLLFWAETCIVGFFNVFKILLAGKGTEENLGAGFMAGFFVVHYGLFVGVQSFFLFSFFEKDLLFSMEQFLYSAGGMFLSYLLGFITDLVNRVYKETDPNTQMFQPYGRIFTQQFFVIFGGVIMSVTGYSQGLVPLLLLIVFKVLFDVLWTVALGKKKKV